MPLQVFRQEVERVFSPTFSRNNGQTFCPSQPVEKCGPEFVIVENTVQVRTEYPGIG